MKATQESTSGRKAIHTKFVAEYKALKVGEEMRVKIPASLSLRGGGVLKKSEQIGFNLRNRLSVTLHNHLAEDPKRGDYKIKSTVRGNEIVFWKGPYNVTAKASKAEKTSKRVAATASKVLKDPKATKDAKTVAASALTQAAGVPKRKGKTSKKSAKKVAKKRTKKA